MEIMGKGKNGVGFGKVDITVEKDLQKEFEVKEAPELKLFFEGNRLEPISCQGKGGCVCACFLWNHDAVVYMHRHHMQTLWNLLLISFLLCFVWGSYRAVLRALLLNPCSGTTPGGAWRTI